MAAAHHKFLLACACFSLISPASAEDPRRVKVEFRRAESKPMEGLKEVTLPGAKFKVYIYKEAEITNQDIANARAIKDVMEQPAVEISFTKEGRKKMATLSQLQLGRPLAILVDEKVVCAPIVRQKFSEKALITGQFSQAEAERIAKSINAK